MIWNVFEAHSKTAGWQLWSHNGVRLIPDYNQEVKEFKTVSFRHSLCPRCCRWASSGNCTRPCRKLCSSCLPLASVRPGCKRSISCRSRKLEMEKKGTRGGGWAVGGGIFFLGEIKKAVLSSLVNGASVLKGHRHWQGLQYNISVCAGIKKIDCTKTPEKRLHYCHIYLLSHQRMDRAFFPQAFSNHFFSRRYTSNLLGQMYFCQFWFQSKGGGRIMHLVYFPTDSFCQTCSDEPPLRRTFTWSSDASLYMGLEKMCRRYASEYDNWFINRHVDETQITLFHISGSFRGSGERVVYPPSVWVNSDTVMREPHEWNLTLTKNNEIFLHSWPPHNSVLFVSQR